MSVRSVSLATAIAEECGHPVLVCIGNQILPQRNAIFDAEIEGQPAYPGVSHPEADTSVFESPCLD